MMPRPRTIGRCVTRGCRGRWQLTPRNRVHQFCLTCAQARKRVRDRKQAEHGRFIRKQLAREGAGVIRTLAVEYEATGWLNPYQHGDGEYSVSEWRQILTEAKTLGEALITDEQFQAELAELRAQDAAIEAADRAAQLARLEEALAFVTEAGDALGFRIVSERIVALTCP